MLAVLSVLYLAFPLLIFFAGWFWWPYALCLVLVLVASVGKAVIGMRREAGSQELPAGAIGQALVIAAVTIGVLYFSGVGGFGFQRSDWEKHTAMLTELSRRPWPVRLTSADGAPDGGHLTYYVAYYLPAALIGRALGPMAAHMALFAWTFAGLCLVALHVVRLVGAPKWWLWAAWFFLSGMDVVGAGLVFITRGDWTRGVEWWPRFGIYMSNTSLLIWVPQHMLAGWLATGLIMSRAEQRAPPATSVLVAALTMMWSPFVTLGLVPFVVAAVAGSRQHRISSTLVTAAAIIGVASLTFLAGVGGGAMVRGWNAALVGPWVWTVTWIAIVVLDFGAYAGLAFLVLRNAAAADHARSRWSRTWLAILVVVLAVLPVYRIGLYNDLMMRSCIPAFFALWVVVLRVLTFARPAGTGRLVRVLLVGCLAIAALLPINQWRNQILNTGPFPNFIGGSPERSIASLERPIRRQYLGRPDSWFARHLAP
jgi:hypothetical protein